MATHANKDVSDLIRLSGVYVKYCLSIAQASNAEININMNLIEDAYGCCLLKES